MKIVNPTAVLGEDVSCLYLVKRGYKILERNFRKGYKEIDIVALDKDTLVFIEVKTRTSQSYGSPFESIAPWKLHSLITMAKFYKLLNPHLPDIMRIDAIGVTVFEGRVENIEHLQNITGF